MLSLSIIINHCGDMDQSNIDPPQLLFSIVFEKQPIRYTTVSSPVHCIITRHQHFMFYLYFHRELEKSGLYMYVSILTSTRGSFTRDFCSLGACSGTGEVTNISFVDDITRKRAKQVQKRYRWCLFTLVYFCGRNMVAC